MSKFNEKTRGTKTFNYEGGEAYTQSPELQLVNILLTSFVEDKFYESAGQTMNRLKDLVLKVNPEFAAKAAVYARHLFGMRSITHVLASELARYASQTDWGPRFYKSVIRRPDDILEILSYHKKNGQKLTNAMKKGLGEALNNFDEYQLAKYRGETREFKLVDAFNLLHPIPKDEKQNELYRKLVNGELKSTETWEAKISATEGNQEAKQQAWADLIDSGKISYFALLRNLRNIIQDAPGKIEKVASLLTDEKRIRKSLVLPFRFLTAMKVLEERNTPRKIMIALAEAIEISVANVPKFEGETLVVLDTSYSMNSQARTYQARVSEIGAIFAMALYKANDCEFMTFDNHARYLSFNPTDSLLTLTRSVPFQGGGTNVHDVFRVANKPYHRIVILTDEQSWISPGTPVGALNNYRKNNDANPYIYSFDLQGYGSMQFPESMTYCISGFSEKVFDIMSLLESDKNALLNKIKAVSL